MKNTRFFRLWLLFLPTALVQAQPAPLNLVLPQIQFSAEKSSLNAAARQQLDAVATLLKASPKVNAEIGAHTDASGSASYNLRLSQSRATAVRDYLVKQGIATKRLKAKGYGESRPLNRCGRGTRCSDAEKQKNRRVELTLTGLPADSASRAPWLNLAGVAAKKTVSQPEVPKMEPRTKPLPEANNSEPLPPPTQGKPETSGDYFPELKDRKTTVPKPLPRSFTGYTIELTCREKPLAAGAEVLSLHDPVYLQQDTGMQYCYFTGAFYTLPEAQQFLKEKIAPQVPGARIAIFTNGSKSYFSN